MNAKTPATSRSISSPAQAAIMAEDVEHSLIDRKVGKWSLERDIPKDSWICVGVDDLGEPNAICEMCEYKRIRNVHRMYHHATGLTLRAGCVCAGHMEGNIAAAVQRDRDMQNAAKRLHTRQSYLDKAWKALESTPVKALAKLRTIHRNALGLGRKATKDFERYGSDPHLVLELDSGVFAIHSQKAVERAQKLQPSYRLAQELADPTWGDTAKGERFETSYGDIVQAYNFYGVFRYGYQLRLDEMEWCRSDFDTLDDAKDAGVKALTRALRKTGRLPRRAT